jgi:histidinol-phosphate aminotransferase
VNNQRILLDRNENQYGPSPACLEVLRRVSSAELSFYSRDYERKVKSRLSERLAELHGVPEERILLSYGSEDLLKQAVHCYLREGDTMLIPNLSWWYYKSVASEVGGVTKEFPLEEDTNGFQYDVGRVIERLKAERPRIVLIASPNNPTGHSLSGEQLRALLEESGDTLLILDEAYWGFSENDSDRVSGLVDAHDRLLVLRTFSKFYALARARIGYALAGRALGRLIRFSTRYLGYNFLSEQLALAALTSNDYYAEMKVRIVRERNRYAEKLRAFPGWKPYRSVANFFLARIPDKTTPTLRDELGKKGISIKFFEEERLRDCVRITIGREDQNSIVLAALEEFATHSVRADRAQPIGLR